VAVDPVGGHIYVALAGVYILSYELDGSKDPQELEQGELAGDIDLALDGEHLYWNYEETAGLTPSVISRSKLDLSEKEQQFITEGQGVQRPQSVATANGHVYWANDPPLEIKPGSELYRYQASTGALEDVSAGSGAEDGAEVQGVLGASRDGSVVYFVANGDLDGAGPAEAGDCTGLLGHGSGQCSLYRWQAGGGDPSFVARLDVGDGDDADWAATTSRVFPDPNFQKTAQVSGDGKVLLFHSGQQLTPYDNTPPNEACGRTTTEPFEPLPCPQLYLYRAGAGVSCVSCDPSGAAPAGAPDLGDVYPGTNTIPPSTASLASRNLAADGNKVFFETPDALVPADTNGEAGCPPEPRLIGSLLSCLDVYEWEAAGSGGCAEASPAWSAQDGGCLYLLSTGKGTESAALADASESGDDVFFFTRARLVGQDEDELTDVYDARVDGGLAAQSPPAPAPACEETEACHGAPPAPPPPAPGPATPGFHGPGNPKPKCKRSQVRRHGKCSRRHKQRKGHRRHRQKHGRSESGRGAAR
jgi:hypothetical protein